MNEDLIEQAKRYFVSDMLAVVAAQGLAPEETNLFEAMQLMDQNWESMRGVATARESLPRPAEEPPACSACGAAGVWVWIDDLYGTRKVGTRHQDVVVTPAHWAAELPQHKPGCPTLRAQTEIDRQFSADDCYAQIETGSMSRTLL
ncbi:MAG TPA: hypothetical protein VGM03_07120 [Phycisphaerae bacterium]|jgi:hypothetical protein